jgi:hypothetical protein
LRGAEKNWSVTELECGAVVWVVTKFRVLLLGRRFVLHTDHIALQWMLGCVKEPPVRSKLVRWILILAEYDMDIKHKPGKEMEPADALSRAFQVSVRSLEAEQLEDKELIKRWEALNREDPDQWRMEGRVKGKVLRGEGERERWVPWIPVQEQEEWMRGAHDSLYGGGHFGQTKTVSKLKRMAWWPQMDKMVRGWVTSCGVCARVKAGRQPTVGHKKVGWRPVGHTIHMDYLTDLPLTERGNRHVLVMVDRGSDLMLAVPTKTRSAVEAVEAVVMQWVARYGSPQVIATDNEKSFTGKEFRGMCGKFGIKKFENTAHHPAGNGEVESRMRPLSMMMRAYAKKQDRWDVYLPLFCLCYNGTPHASTGLAPFYLMFGREVIHPVQLQYGDLVLGESAFDLEYKRIVRVLEEGVDQEAVSSEMRKGDRVLVKNFKKGEKQKLDPKWEGPHEIIRVEGRVMELKDGRRMHESNLKWVKGDLREELKEDEVEDLLPRNELYEVRKIVDEKVVDGLRWYRVRWKGMRKDCDEWRSLADLQCDALIQEFQERQKKKSAHAGAELEVEGSSQLKESVEKKVDQPIEGRRRRSPERLDL